MDKQVQSAKSSYESTLSSEQIELLRAVETGEITPVQRLFGLLSETIWKEKWLDYVLLTIAVQKEHKTVTRFLLKSGCRTKTEEKTKFLCTPLYYAVEQGDVRIACELVKKGASVRDTDANEKSPLEYAVQTNKSEILEVILRHRKYILSHEKFDPQDRNDQALLQIACYKNNMQAVRDLAELKFPLDMRSSFTKEDWKGFTLLHFSVSGRRGSTVDMLLRSELDMFLLDGKGKSPVHIAFRNYEHRSYTLAESLLLHEWVNKLAHKDFSNPEDEFGLSHFHIICCGTDAPILAAATTNAVQFFLKNKVNVNQAVTLNDPSYGGYTALHFAAINIRPAITKLLTDHGADPTKTDKGGLTPLHLACDRSLSSLHRTYRNTLALERDRLELAKLLLNHGADVDAKDSQGSTPIHYSFSRSSSRRSEKDESLTRLLISHNRLNANLTDPHGLSYLHIACATDLAAVKILVENGAPLSSFVKSNGSFKPGYSPLHFAVSYGKVEIVEYLLNHGVDPNTPINQNSLLTPLHLACTFTYTECYPLDQAPNVSSVRPSQSDQMHRIRIIELLLKHGALINARNSSGDTPLITACVIPLHSSHTYYYVYKSTVPAQVYLEQRRVIEVLLRHGADVQLQNSHGKSVLHVISTQPSQALGNENTNLSKLVLANGANVNTKDKQGLTPLHVAVKSSMCENWNPSLVQLFLEYGADVNATSSDLYTPLHIAVKNFVHGYENHVKIFLCLLDHPEIDLNIRNEFGETPLHVAGDKHVVYLMTGYYSDRERALSLINHRFCIEKLLHAGADMNILNSEGCVPMHQLYKWLLDKSSRCDQHYSNFLTFIVTHMKKFVRMNMFVSEKVGKELDSLSLLSLNRSQAIDFAIDEELDKLKSKKVDQYTSLYEILSKDANDMSKHMKNEDFKKMMTSPELRSHFPIFHDVLRRKFKAGSERSLVLGPAKEALEDVLQVSWPDSCSEHILQYLSIYSLRTLAKSIPAENARKRSLQGSDLLGEPQSKILRSQ